MSLIIIITVIVCGVFSLLQIELDRKVSLYILLLNLAGLTVLAMSLTNQNYLELAIAYTITATLVNLVLATEEKRERIFDIIVVIVVVVISVSLICLVAVEALTFIMAA